MILLGKGIIRFFKKMQMGSTDLNNNNLKTGVLFIPLVLSYLFSSLYIPEFLPIAVELGNSVHIARNCISQERRSQQAWTVKIVHIKGFD